MFSRGSLETGGILAGQRDCSVYRESCREPEKLIGVGKGEEAYLRTESEACSARARGNDLAVDSSSGQILDTLTLVNPKDRKTLANKLLVTSEQAAAVRNLALARAARTT